MNKRPFIAEFHDIGKLVDKESLEQAGIKINGHTFRNFDFSQLGIPKPSSPSWYTQFTDKVGSLQKIATEVPREFLPDVLLTRIADELAATVSRTWFDQGKFKEKNDKRKFVKEGIHVLWNPDFYRKEKDKGKKWAAFSTRDELKAMFRLFDECKEASELFQQFEENLRLTPEDKSAPVNITSLFTHLELSGKTYRVLKKHSKIIREEDRLYLSYNEKKAQQLKQITGERIKNDKSTYRGKWIYRLVFCNVGFPQSFARLQDLNILGKRTNLIKNFAEKEGIKDYLLFFTDDFMCLFLPKEDELKLQELLKPFLELGFIINYKEMEAELFLLTSSMERAYKRLHHYKLESKRHLKLYEKCLPPNLSSEILPPLCDICQLRHGKERIKDHIREYLCDTCYAIREKGTPAREYAEWGEEEGLKAGWMKITLDQGLLLKTLSKLFEEYVYTCPEIRDIPPDDKKELIESFRPLAVQMDFIKDYKLLLKKFHKQIYETKNNEGNPIFTRNDFLYPIDGYQEFGIFKVYSGKNILAVLDLFYSLIKEHFPECMKYPSCFPIKLSLSIAQVKYPYQKHWRFLSAPENSINIQSPGSIKLTMDITQYKLLREKIRKENQKLSHFLHRLADIETKTKSNTMVMLEILENRKKFPTLLELIQNGLSACQILAFYKLTREETTP